jgi:hypothetical protein
MFHSDYSVDRTIRIPIRSAILVAIAVALATIALDVKFPKNSALKGTKFIANSSPSPRVHTTARAVNQGSRAQS